MSDDSHDLVVPVSAEDHAQGGAGAAVTLVEYGDYQCPACGMAYPLIKGIQRESGSHLRFVFRNFPLTEVHPLAQAAAECAETAALVHQFWDMHDWLYDRQDQWVAYGIHGLEEGLKSVGVDMATVERALNGSSVDERIRADFMGGVRSGVNGTPCFFVNGYRFDGDADALEYAIANLIERS